MPRKYSPGIVRPRPILPKVLRHSVARLSLIGLGGIRLLGLFLAVYLAILPLQARAISAEELLRHERWGPFTLSTNNDNFGIFEHHENLIISKEKKVLKKIPSYMISSIDYITLRGGHVQDLKVDVWHQPPAQCCIETVFLRIEEDRPRELFRYSAGHYDVWFDGAKDLDNDGNKEIVAPTDVLAFFDDMCMACYPAIYLVIGWNGRTWGDVTRRFPGEISKIAESFQKDLKKQLNSGVNRYQGPEVDSPIYSNAVGYLGNIMRIKEDYHQELEWLRNHLPPSVYARLKTSAPNLMKRAKSAGRKVKQG